MTKPSIDIIVEEDQKIHHSFFKAATFPHEGFVYGKINFTAFLSSANNTVKALSNLRVDWDVDVHEPALTGIQ